MERSTARSESRGVGGSVPMVLLAAAFLLPPPPAHATAVPGPFFYPDDPIAEDRDRLPIPRPAESEISQYFDFLENSFGHPGGEGWLPAADVNTLDEVPNSSWFTNRHGARRMSADALARGAGGIGPAMDVPWTVVRGKSEGISPGFTIRDGRGDLYFVKFDPKAYPELATAAEAIATGFFHAIGYHVPRNNLVLVSPSRIRVGKDATIRDGLGRERAMTPGDLRDILARAPIRADGTIRVIASRAVDGAPLGHFRYYGTRPDDGNDIIPHQHRRELRALRLFAAWLNHDDARSINTLDVYAGDEGTGAVIHYLIDFGSCLGSGSVKVQTRRAGNETMWDPGPMLRTLATFGLWVRPYLKIRYPDFPAVGRFEAESFRPEAWVPEYPNPAFRRMDRADAFWAAKIVMAFTDEDVRTLVRAGRIDDPEAERYLADTLIERRDRIGRYGFGRVPPLDRFVLEGDTLRFANLAADHGFAPRPAGYSAEWRAYDNGRRAAGVRIGIRLRSRGPALPVPPPAGAVGPVYRVVEIRIEGDGPAAWDRPVRVYLRECGGRRKIVGIDRGGRGEAP